MNMKKVKKTLGIMGTKIGIGLTGADEKSAETLSANRARGNAIKDTLVAIPFHQNRIHNEEDPNFLETMKTMRNSLVETLDKTDPLSQDISKIDQQLQFAADAWSSAVKEGHYGKAKWSIAALSRGVKNFRTNIPNDKAEQIDEVLEKRLEQAKVYTSLIRNAEAIDTAERAIKNITVQLNDKNKQLEPIRQNVGDARTDKEKVKMLARIKAVQLGMIKATDLTEKEAEFRDMLDEGVNLSKSVEMLRNNIETAKTNLNTAKNMFAASRAKLSIEELSNNEELIKTYTKVLDEMVKTTKSALIYAEKVREGYLSYQSQMDAVWGSLEGQNALTEIINLAEGILAGGNEDSHVDIAIGMLEDLNEKDVKNQDKEDQLDKLLEENKNENYNYNYNT